jgi:hypothetical protein
MKARFQLSVYASNGKLVYTLSLETWAEVDEETALAESEGYSVKLSW